MATTTRILDANVNGTVYTANANDALEALDTCHSGATSPTDEVANGKLWLDTSTTPGILKIYNNATWEVVHSGTVDINGGTIDGATINGTVIGGATPAAVTGTTLTATGAFTSLGIDDNATATAVTIDASGAMYVGGTEFPTSVLGTGATRHTFQGAGDVYNVLWNTSAPAAGNKSRLFLGAKTGQGATHFGGGYIEGGLNNGTDSAGYLSFKTTDAASTALTRMTIDSNGSVLVGKTVNDLVTEGVRIRPNALDASRDSGTSLNLNRNTTDGEIVSFSKDGTTVGSIGNIGIGLSVSAGTSGILHLASNSSNGIEVLNSSASGAPRLRPSGDNTTDLGDATHRFDDVFATNGTIQTSDRNEKEAIASLTPTEMLVAARLSSCFKNFKWKDAVAEKGLDAARLHSGIIAQDVQDAFAAEGLDASDYAMFISGTWWETQTDVPAVEAVAEVVDEDGVVVTEAVEAVAAYTRTDTYHTLEEAPEGATERTRLGVRYPELLAFVAAYNDQRFLSLEARVAALEP